MKHNSIDVENAFLEWLNHLDMGEKKLESLTQLKDGVILFKLLHSVEKECFPAEGISLHAGDHWSLCAMNLKKLNALIEKYLEEKVKVSIEKDYINVQAIAQNNDRMQILRLCERSFAVVINSSNKEKYIDPILTLEEIYQTILMDFMLKYVEGEDKKKPMLFIEKEALEKMQEQIKKTEAERLSLSENVNTLESENKELNTKMTELLLTIKDVTSNGEKCKQAMEQEIGKLGLQLASLNKIKLETEAEKAALKQDMGKLKQEFNECKEANKALLNVKEQENIKLRDELYIVQQRANKVSKLEALIEQQRDEIEEAKSFSEIHDSIIKKVEYYEQKIYELEKDKKALTDEGKKLATELFAYQNSVKGSSEEIKKFVAKATLLEESLRASEEKKSAWEQRAKQAEEKLVKIVEENDALKLNVNAGSLLTKTDIEKQKEKIIKLEEQITILSSRTPTFLTNKIHELTEKLEKATNQQARLERENLLITKRNEELNKDLTSLLDEISNDKLKTSLKSDSVKDLLALKNDKKNVTISETHIKELMEKVGSLSVENETFKSRYVQLMEEVSNLQKKKNDAEAKCQTLTNSNRELEKQRARLEETLLLVQEERKKVDDMLKDVIQENEKDKAKKISEELAKQKESLLKHSEEKIKKLTEDFEKMEKVFLKKEEELKTELHFSREKNVSMVLKYENDIAEMKVRHEKEREASAKGLKQLSEINKRQEEMLSSSIYEIGGHLRRFVTEQDQKPPDIPTAKSKVQTGLKRTASPQVCKPSDAKPEVNSSSPKKQSLITPTKFSQQPPPGKKPPRIPQRTDSKKIAKASKESSLA